MKRVSYVILSLVLILGLCKACIKADIDTDINKVNQIKEDITVVNYPIEQNININGYTVSAYDIFEAVNENGRDVLEGLL